MASSAVKIGNVAEGAFAIALSLMVIQNIFVKKKNGESATYVNTNEIPEFKLSVQNIKNIMQKVDVRTWESGGTWENSIYDGNAKAKGIGNTPEDVLKVNLFIRLNAAEVRGYYGADQEEKLGQKWDTVDKIIGQMISDSSRYKSIVQSRIKQYLNNNIEETIIVDIKAIGTIGAISGGSIKGDVVIDTTITPIDKINKRPISFKLPPLSFSLKAASSPPTTLSNQSPLNTFKQFEREFGINVIGNDALNESLSNLTNIDFIYVEKGKGRKSQNLNFNKVLESGKQNSINLDGTIVNIEGKRKYDILNPEDNVFKILYPRAVGSKKSALKSWALREYYKDFLNAFVLQFSGSNVQANQNNVNIRPTLLTGTSAEKVWNILTKSAFGSDRAEVISFGINKSKVSSLDYITKLKIAAQNQIIVKTEGENLVFHLPAEPIGDTSRNTKLFHLRYKNLTRSNEVSAAKFEINGSVEIKIMIEAGPMFYEPTKYKPISKLEWNRQTKKLIVINDENRSLSDTTI